jgi:hypothetical protein
MTEKRESNARLKAAVESVPVPPYLETRIRARIREAHQPRWRFAVRFAPVAAGLAACFGGLLAYQLGYLRLTANSQESYIASVTTQIATLMRVGLGDHIHCSVFRKYPKDPPTAEEVVSKMPEQYAGLAPIVRSQVPENYRMTLAHECRYHKRRFVHLSLMDDANMMSVVITRKAEGESFRTEDMLPALTEAGIPMYQTGVQRFQVTAFETRDHLVYFISDLSKQKNAEMMLALAPGLKSFLSKLEL